MKIINTDELRTMMDEMDDLTVVNTLSKEHAKELHIEGTEKIPFEQENFTEKIERVAGGKSEPVVVYCASTECTISEKAAEQLEKAGFEKVYEYSGGVKAWQSTEKAKASA